MLRRLHSEYLDTEIERDIATEKADIAKLEAEHKQTVGEAKYRLNAKIDAAHQQIHERHNKLHERIESAKREAVAKINVVQEQGDKAKDAAKARLEKRIAEMRAHQALRAEKLGKAWKLVKEAARI